MSTITISCDCKVCNGATAEVRSSLEALTTGNSKTARGARHSYVCMANSALLRNSNALTR